MTVATWAALRLFASRSDVVAGSEKKCGRNCRLTHAEHPEEDFFAQQLSPGRFRGAAGTLIAVLNPSLDN